MINSNARQDDNIYTETALVYLHRAFKKSEFNNAAFH